MTDSKISFEDVFGADRAGREIRARDHAVLYEIAKRTPQLANHERAATLERIVADYVHAGLVREARAARRELIATYQLDGRPPAEALDVLREMIEPALEDSHPDDSGVEDYTRSDGVPL